MDALPRLRRAWRSTALLCWMLAAPGLSGAESHETPTEPGLGAPEWDRAHVEVLANSIRDALGAALEAAERQPPQATAMQQRTRDAAVSEMRRVHVAAVDYARKIRDGWSREQSRAWFDLVREGYSSALEAAGDAVGAAEVDAQLSLAEAQLEQLGRYYDAP